MDRSDRADGRKLRDPQAVGKGPAHHAQGGNAAGRGRVRSDSGNTDRKNGGENRDLTDGFFFFSIYFQSYVFVHVTLCALERGRWGRGKIGPACMFGTGSVLPYWYRENMSTLVTTAGTFLLTYVPLKRLIIQWKLV